MTPRTLKDNSAVFELQIDLAAKSEDELGFINMIVPGVFSHDSFYNSDLSSHAKACSGRVAPLSIIEKGERRDTRGAL